MIEGIEILNKTEIMDTPGWFCWVIFIGAVIIFMGLSMVFELVFDAETIGNIIGGVCMIIFLGSMCTKFINSIPTGRYQYEVTMDESVPFEKLYEQYDVIEQRGNIWVIEDKEKTSE